MIAIVVSNLQQKGGPWGLGVVGAALVEQLPIKEDTGALGDPGLHQQVLHPREELSVPSELGAGLGLPGPGLGAGDEPVRVPDHVAVGDDRGGAVDLVHVAQGDPGLQTEVRHHSLQPAASEDFPHVLQMEETR